MYTVKIYLNKYILYVLSIQNIVIHDVVQSNDTDKLIIHSVW